MDSTPAMAWTRLFDTRRLNKPHAHAEPGRTAFNSDHDRIVFSGAFRRLARKTQVHPLASNDHVHNRLTHSLEVACVGRSLGVKVGEQLQEKLPPGIGARDVGDIVEAACLAHDIGNPPFGHVGEEAIKSWFARNIDGLGIDEEAQRDDLCNFEGNAQGFRVVTSSEYHAFEGGMRLTHATLGAFMKYPWAYGKGPKKEKFGVFQSELGHFRQVAEALQLKRISEDHYCRHPLAHLMEMADDFCYRLLDMEDGIEMGLVTWDEFHETFRPVLEREMDATTRKKVENLRPGRRPPLVRGKIISHFVEDAARTFLAHEQRLLEGEVGSLIELCSDEVNACLGKARDFANQKLFSHPRKAELEIGAYSVIGTLLDVIVEAVGDKPHDARSRQVLSLIGPTTFNAEQSRKLEGISRYERLRRALDFISGMTDHYATYLSNQFNGMGAVR